MNWTDEASQLLIRSPQDLTPVHDLRARLTQPAPTIRTTVKGLRSAGYNIRRIGKQSMIIAYRLAD